MNSAEIEEQQAAVRRGPAARRPAKLGAWLWGVFATAALTFVLQLTAVTWGQWMSPNGVSLMANLPAALVYANPVGLTLTAALIVRFGPSWARVGVFDKRWNYAGFFLATTFVYLVLASVAAGLFQLVTTSPFQPGMLLFGFALALLFTLFGGLPLWAFGSALAIGPRGGGR